MPKELQLEKSRLGDVGFNKGKAAGRDLLVWDGVQPCRGQNCPIYNRCYFSWKNTANSNCLVQKDYIATLLNTISNTYHILDDMQLFRIGMMIVPLYSQLVRLKIIELGVVDVVTTNEKGVQAIHPILKEVREVMKSINTIWKDLEMVPPKLPEIIPPKKDDVEISAVVKTGNTVEGDRSHVERISNRVIDRKGVIR